MELRSFQPNVCRILLEMPRRACERQRGVRKSKIWIAHDGIRQMLGRLLHLRRIPGRAQPEPTHKLRICQRIPAVPWAFRSRLRSTQRPVQSSCYLLRDFVFQVCHPLHIEIALPAEAQSRCGRSEEHTSELQSRRDLVCRLLLEKKKKKINSTFYIKKKKKRNKNR